MSSLGKTGGVCRTMACLSETRETSRCFLRNVFSILDISLSLVSISDKVNYILIKQNNHRREHDYIFAFHIQNKPSIFFKIRKVESKYLR